MLKSLLFRPTSGDYQKLDSGRDDSSGKTMQDSAKVWADSYKASTKYLSEYTKLQKLPLGANENDSDNLPKSLSQSAATLERLVYKPTECLLTSTFQKREPSVVRNRLHELQGYATLRKSFTDRIPRSLAEMIHTKMHREAAQRFGSMTFAWPPPSPTERLKMRESEPGYTDDTKTVTWRKLHQKCISSLGQEDRGWHESSIEKTSDCSICQSQKSSLSEIASLARECDIPIRYSSTGDHRRDLTENGALAEFVDLTQYMSDKLGPSGPEILAEIEVQRKWQLLHRPYNYSDWSALNKRISEGMQEKETEKEGEKEMGGLNEMAAEKKLVEACSTYSPAVQSGISFQQDVKSSQESKSAALDRVIGLNSRLEDVCRLSLPPDTKNETAPTPRSAWDQYANLLSDLTTKASTSPLIAPTRYDIRNMTQDQQSYSDLHTCVSHLIEAHEAREEEDRQETARLIASWRR